MTTFTVSERSFVGDNVIYNSLDDSREMFNGFLRRKPTLEMALREAGVPNHDIVLDDAMENADKARDNPEIAALGLSDDEAGAISCYTLQSAEGVKSPYDIINNGLAGSRNRTGLYSTKRLIFLLLSGLRKLPRTSPSKGQIFYRGIRRKIPTTKEEATKVNKEGKVEEHQYYSKGRTVTWWAFTSTTTDIEATQNFIKGAAESTMFNIGGEDLWGYKIKAFSPFANEEEVLLEPEAKIMVNGFFPQETLYLEDGALKTGSFTTFQVVLQKFDHLVLEDIIPVGGSKTISTQRSPISTQQNEGRGNISGGGSGPNSGFGLPFKAPEKKPTPPLPVKKSEPSSSVPPKKSPSPLPASKPQTVQKKWECVWKECPDNVDWNRKYSVNVKNPRIATFIGGNYWCTIIGNTSLPLSKITSWSIKILKSRWNNGEYIFIGIAPTNINQNICNYNNCGWYFDCYYSTLWSGPPHNYSGKEYGPRKGGGQYVHTGDIVGVVMDTAKGELSFTLNGVNLGVAYEGIPLDKPLVPCVILGWNGDSVELII